MTNFVWKTPNKIQKNKDLKNQIFLGYKQGLPLTICMWKKDKGFYDTRGEYDTDWDYMTEINLPQKNITSKIYVIQVMEKLEENKITHFPDFGAERIVGWFQDKSEAMMRVRHNIFDIWETCYDYAIIEEVEEGLYPSSCRRWLYKYYKSNNEYEPIPEPDFLSKFSSIVMG